MERTHVVTVDGGLHARPAAQLVAEAARQPVPVSIRTATRGPVSAASILGVMTLGAMPGDTVTLSTETDDEQAGVSLDALVAFLERAGAS